eukprot:6029596-Amphidinium_carterae.1
MFTNHLKGLCVVFQSLTTTTPRGHFCLPYHLVLAVPCLHFATFVVSFGDANRLVYDMRVWVWRCAGREAAVRM